MYMAPIDWLIVAGVVGFVFLVVQYARRYVSGVSEFIAGRRLAGRYLLTVAGDMANNMSAVMVIASWEAAYHSGWGATFWQVLREPFLLIMMMSGWVLYRYRQTRALTLSQFFEQRYSRHFRIAAGLISFLAGTLNFAIFPSIGARFLIYVCGIPQYTLSVFGAPVSLTYAIIMALLLGFSLWVTLRGGQIGIMLSDGLQGVMVLFLTLGLAYFLINRFGWIQIGEALKSAPNPDTASMINPFKTSATRDFNIWFYLIAIFGSFYGRLAWQGNSGYNAAARTPHEARMAAVLGTLRSSVIFLVMGFIGMAAYTMMHHPEFSGIADLARVRIFEITNPAIQKQMTVPIAIGTVLPAGLLGCLVAIIVSMAITTDDTYLHSWGSIFIQDVVMPLRKKPFTPEAHLTALRRSIAGVALFAYFFSLFFMQTQYILMFFAITGAIFTAGAGSAIIGGLYWKRGTTGGAWAALLTGSILAVSAIIIQRQPFIRIPFEVSAPGAASVTVNDLPAIRSDNGTFSFHVPFWRQEEWQSLRIKADWPDGITETGIVHHSYGINPPTVPVPKPVWTETAEQRGLELKENTGTLHEVPENVRSKLYYRIRSINGQRMWFFSILCAIAAYVTTSLAGRRVFNLDQLLHRGPYALSDTPNVRPAKGWRAVFGFSSELTRGDRFIYFAAMTWSLGWLAVYLIVIAINLIKVQPDDFWVTFFKTKFFAFLTMGCCTAIWFGLGAIRDSIQLCRDLKAKASDTSDDGWVKSPEKKTE